MDQKGFSANECLKFLNHEHKIFPIEEGTQKRLAVEREVRNTVFKKITPWIYCILGNVFTFYG